MERQKDEKKLVAYFLIFQRQRRARQKLVYLLLALKVGVQLIYEYVRIPLSLSISFYLSHINVPFLEQTSGRYMTAQKKVYPTANKCTC